MPLNPRYKFFFALLRYSLGIDAEFASDAAAVHVLSAEDWTWMREEAIRQALVGVLYMGIKKLPEDLRPPRLLLMQWAFDAENIRGTNQKVNEVAAKLTQMFKERGRDSIILKGPANALLYPDPFVRSCGDVDIMLPGGRDSVVKLLTEMGLMEGAEINSLHVGLAEGLFPVSVEVHYVASNTYSPFQNKRMHKFLADEFPNFTRTSEGFCVPSARYALIMQLSHIKIHFFSVGIGLRQLIDYYFVLKSSSEDDCREVSRLLKKFGLYHMAQAIMWLLKKVLHLEKTYELCKPDESRGKILLRVALNGGNFGAFDESAGGSIFKLLVKHYARVPRLLRFDFFDELWREIGWPKDALKDALSLKRK